MQMKCKKQALSLILCMTLTVAMAFYATGCNGKDKDAGAVPAGTENAAWQDGDVLGEGGAQFDFSVTDLDGNEKSFTVQTDQKTVGDALQEIGMIAGEEGEYGLYVKTVNGVTLDYETDGAYWAFYVNGEYAQTGVDSTDIAEGESYSFQAEKQ